MVKSKFDLGLPIYRVSQDLTRYGVKLGAGTLGTWVNTVGGEKVVPLINLMNEALFVTSFMHIDETPLQVLRSGKAVGAEHYIVVRAGGPPSRRIILYDYIASRTKGLKQLLIGADGAYRGKLVSDGLERYHEVAAELNLLHFGCLQHCRSMFFKARKVSQLPTSRTLADVAIETYIRPVYQMESEIKALQGAHEQRDETLPEQTVLQLREQKSKPVRDQFKAWVDELLYTAE